MSTAEVASRANRKVSTICRWVYAGKLHPIYKGEGLRGFYMFDAEQVEAFLQERTAEDSPSSDA